MKKVYLICICFCFTLQLSAQKTEENSEQETIEWLDNILQINKPIEPLLTFPYIEIGAGLFNFHGDITNSNSPNFSVGTPGMHFSLTEPISPNFSIGFHFLKGTITGNSYPTGLTYGYNFTTQVTSFGTHVEYNFGNIKKLPPVEQRILSPYVSVGFEVLQRAEAWGDLYSDSTKYYSWSDGTLRDIKESKYNVSNSNIVYRDYIYETSYERENIDKIAYFSPLTYSIPIDLGLQYNFSQLAQLKFGYQYHISLSNSLDNISQEGTNYKKYPERLGDSKPDGFSYAYMSLQVNLTVKSPYKNKLDTSHTSTFMEFWDADKDGIDETEDDCPYTPAGTPVFANGCPLDDDKDKTPNYRDIEKNTRAFYADKYGIGMSEKDLLQQMKIPKKVEQREIYRFYPKLLNGGTVYKQFYKKIPWKYKILDTDKNEYVDIDEMLNAIDTFFDEDSVAGANLSVKDLYELIEFFFLQ